MGSERRRQDLERRKDVCLWIGLQELTGWSTRRQSTTYLSALKDRKSGASHQGVRPPPGSTGLSEWPWQQAVLETPAVVAWVTELQRSRNKLIQNGYTSRVLLPLMLSVLCETVNLTFTNHRHNFLGKSRRKDFFPAATFSQFQPSTQLLTPSQTKMFFTRQSKRP